MIFISVVSHGHSGLINQLSCLSNLCGDFVVIVKSNKRGDDLHELSYNSNFHWINDRYGCGFGHNNNIIFNYCLKNLSMTKDDYFIILNPDVVISVEDIEQLIKRMHKDRVKLSAINLFKDTELSISDDSIRSFPSLGQFVKSFLGLGNSSVLDKSELNEACQVDWAAGSFLAVETNHYRKLGGFDESYFMYCEDIDICYRSFHMGEAVTYYPDVKAIHLAKHANRKIFSKHFYWHVSSVVRFLFAKLGWTKPKSSLISNVTFGVGRRT